MLGLDFIINVMDIKGLRFVGEENKFYKFTGKNGEKLDMYCAEIFDGVLVAITDYEDVVSYISPEEIYIENLNLSYCLEGRIEWGLKDNRYTYLSKKSFMVDTCPLSVQSYSFPMKKFKGITYMISINNINEHTKNIFSLFGVDILEIYEKFKIHKTYMKRDNPRINEILYGFNSHDFLNVNTYRIKLIEILNYIQNLDTSEKDVLTYYKSSQVKKVKDIRSFLIGDLSKRYTIEFISEKFNISMTTLKKLFKEIYGMPINSYLIDYKINEAEILLKESEKSITEIANLLGYSNVSKFSKIFKDMKGCSPSKFRNMRR
ncbi:AraC family transcriptional regulator [Peptoniphilus sp. oral taxon 386]|uniref:helix-turn-helix domain-containing protein n=1 Tax=Peptoniphilus sp. oral taxon 386 TaxID=652713 RepID=UPI0001DA998D|nr:AraC family transcriptional regulator [Peptoniphilus sp. oral taxon 386]EFI41423.1 transcriptional regulator, AraC family [Peptoniphilus sp. oral taxon 386 str. F0131]